MSNPMFNETTWDPDRERTATSREMTVDGAMTKTVILLMVMSVSMFWMWSTFWNSGEPVKAQLTPYLIGGAIVGLLMAMAGAFVQRWSVIWSLVYAVAEGVFLGAVTMMFQVRWPGLPLSAAVFTVATLLGMVLLYRTGIIKASNGFIRGVAGATVGLALGVGLLFLLNLFGIGSSVTGALYGSGWIGIGFSLLCIGLAAASLVVDFAFIERGAENRLPKHFEWVAAFGLLVTLVWLYLEILSLLAKLRER